MVIYSKIEIYGDFDKNRKKDEMTKIILIDSNSLINRAYYALPMMTNSEGLYTNAVYGYLSMLQRLIAEEQPTHICAVFDEKGKTFRSHMFEGYKAKRKGMPDELAAQLPLLKEVLAAMGIKIIAIEGFEADDIIGTLAKKFKQDTIIVSGDKDCLQLLDDTTRVYHTKRGVTEVKIYDVAALADEGLSPEQVIELKGLAGDSSDNIPGAPGIGDKTARALISEYGSIEGIYSNIDKIKGSLQQRLLTSKDIVDLSKRLATIETHMDIDCCELDDLRFSYPLKRAAIEKMQKLEFRNLITRFSFKDEEAEVFPEELAEQTEVINISDINSLKQAIKEIKYGEKLVIEWGDELIIAFSYKEYHIAIAGGFFGEGITQDAAVEAVLPLYSERYTNIFFDTKSQMHLLDQMFVKVKMPYEDVQLKSYLINSGRTLNTAKELTDVYAPQKQSLAAAILLSNTILDAKIAELELTKLYYEVELPLVECLYGMEKNGFCIDREVLETLSKQYEAELKQLIDAIYEIAGENFNINSNKQLGYILFEKLQLPTQKKNKTGFSVSAEVLEEIEHPIVESLLRYRQLMKLKSTYLDGMKAVMNMATGRVHTSFKQCQTTTGRLSSTEPNLQNIPIRRTEGKEIRKMFIASPGCLIVSADYSQIELRLLAHFSGDPNIIEAYKNAEDIHKLTASKIYNVPLDEVTEEMRSASKAVNFGIIYGISSFGLSRNLSIPRVKAKRYIDEYFKTYPSIKDYMESNVELAEKQGYLKTFMGRIRHFPELKSPNYAIRAFGKRAAMNMPLQGSASDLIKIAMLKVNAALKEGGYKAKMILQVHDELIIDAPENEAQQVMLLLKKCMEEAVPLRIPMLANVSAGHNWYEAK